MIITEIKIFNKIQLIAKLHDITMLKDPYCKPYKEAYITIENFDPKLLSPCQFYILKNELDTKRELQEAFEEVGVDIFNLSGYIEFEIDTAIGIRTLLPPIIEESVELDGHVYQLINDGMHRSCLALLQKRKLNTVYVRGSSVPYYAYPLSGGWTDVNIVTEINKGSIKKIHRITDNKKLYRNFNSAFINCSTPRSPSTEDK